MVEICIVVGIGDRYPRLLEREKEGDYGGGRRQEMIDITPRNINHVFALAC